MMALTKAVQQAGQIIPRNWLNMQKPAIFAHALFGQDYPCGVLMVLQAYTWSLTIFDLLDTIALGDCAGGLRCFLGEARTINHRQLANKILKICDDGDKQYMDLMAYSYSATRAIKKIPTLGDETPFRWDEQELIVALRAKLVAVVMEEGLITEGEHVQHRNEPPYTELLEMSLQKRLSTECLSTWIANEFAAAKPALQKLEDFARRSNSMSSHLFNKNLNAILPKWSFPAESLT